MSAVISPWSFYLRYNISALAISVKIFLNLEIKHAVKEKKERLGNDLILPLSDRADCMWCMTFLYCHVLLSYAVLHLFGF